jgi:hypothetical protein
LFLGLARSDASAAALTAVGAEVRRSTVEDLDGLRAGAAESEGVVHLAFNHDLSQHEAAARAELRAIETFGDALAGSDRPLVIASGGLWGASRTRRPPRRAPGHQRPGRARAARRALVHRAARAHGPRQQHVRHGRKPGRDRP